jgi:thioredoxin 1
MQNVTSSDFNSQVKESTVPVICDFWAQWCGPCRMLKPILENLSSESEGKFKIVGVNTDESPELAIDYMVAALPTIIVFKDGKEIQRLVGFQKKEKLLEALQNS